MNYAEAYQKEMYDDYLNTFKASQEESRKPIICPETFKGQVCKLCEYCKQILFNKNLKNSQISEAAGNLNRKFKYYSSIIFPLVNPSEIYVFEYGMEIYKKLMAMHMDPESEYKGFYDPRTGRNLHIIKTPDPNPKKTSYDVEPRSMATPLLDMSVLSRLPKLDQILELLKTSSVKLIPQSKFSPARTEVRFLPSWFGPGFEIFWSMLKYHYQVSQDVFDAIQRGEVDPFAEFRGVESKASPLTSPIQREPVKPTTTEAQRPKTGWEDFLLQAKTPQMSPEPRMDAMPIIGPSIEPGDEEDVDDTYPECHGKFDPTNPECTGPCKEDGWAQSCVELKEKLAKRRTARRLYK